MVAENAKSLLLIYRNNKTYNTMPYLLGCGIVAFGTDEFLLEITQKTSVVGYTANNGRFFYGMISFNPTLNSD